MKIFDHILDGHEATLQNAQNHARGLDWMEVEVMEQDKPAHSGFMIEEINGVGIYYDYGADYYFFTDETS